MKKEPEDLDIYDSNIEEVDASEYIRDIVTKYGVNVSVFRSCSSLLDGLLPGQRRRLYTFYLEGAFPNKPYKKAQVLLGPVGGLHPHGEISINKSFQNDIKYWESNVQLYDTHGGKGDLTGEKASAVRYLETRLSVYAMKCFFEDFDPEITDMVLNNTRQDMEPVTIPSRYPHFLLTLTTGIAWGNAISIPPFNVNEVFSLTQALIKNPKMTNVYLYPDSPRGYDIIESPDIQEICDTGKGTLKIQARIEYVEEDGKRYLEISGFPDQVFMKPILEQITLLVKNKVLMDIEGMRDCSNLNNVYCRLVLSKNADPDIIKDILYRKTRLRHFISINFNFAGKTKMEPLGLREALLVWIDYSIDYKQRYYNKQLANSKKRLHELDGIIRMLEPKNAAIVQKIVSSSASDNEAVGKLVERFQCTTYQAKVVSGIRLINLNQTAREKYKAEREKVEKKLKELRKIVSSREKIKNIIIDDLDEGMRLFGKPRACHIISEDALKRPIHKFTLIITKKRIKKVSKDAKGVGIIDYGDDIISVYHNIPEDQYVSLFDETGNVHYIQVNKIGTKELASKGSELLEYGISSDIVGSMVNIEMEEKLNDYAVTFFTKNGMIKQTLLSAYKNSRKKMTAIQLNEGDAVSYIEVDTLEELQQLQLVYTRNGLGMAVKLSDINMTDRVTKGVRFINLEEDDTVAGVAGLTYQRALIITEHGWGKICDINDAFLKSKRRVAMTRIMGLSEGDHVLKVINLPDDYQDIKVSVYLTSGSKVDIDMDKVMETSRLSKGKKLLNVNKTDSIYRVRLI